MKNSYEVTLLNQKFVLKTENNEAHVKEVTDYVNRIFEDVSRRAANVSTQNIAILAALNIAEDMFNRESKMNDQIKDWKIRLENLVDEEKNRDVG